MYLPVNNGPDTDQVVGESTEQSLTVSGPCQRNTLGFPGVLADLNEVRLELVDDGLALQIENLNAAGGGSTEPVAVGAEHEGVDDITGLQRVQVLAIIEIPEHGDTVLSTGSREGAIGRYGDSVDVAGVAVVVSAELALAELPDFDNLVPTAGDNDGVQSVRAEADA